MDEDVPVPRRLPRSTANMRSSAPGSSGTAAEASNVPGAAPRRSARLAKRSGPRRSARILKRFGWVEASGSVKKARRE